jgi:LuxR family maltose regulon positive regulatory protein
MLLEGGQADDALAEAGEAIELLDVTRTYAYVGIALSIRAQAHAMRGDIDAARADLARACQIGRAQRLDRVLFRAALAGARIAVDTGVPDEAEALLDEAHAVLEQTGQTRMALLSENHAMHDAVLAAHLHRLGRHDELALLAASALDNAGRAGRVRHRIEFLLWEALAQAGTGDPAAAAQSAGQAIDLAAAGNVLLPFLQAGAAVLPLIEARRSGGARSAFAVRVAEHLEAHPKQIDEPRRRKPTFHQREVQILQLLGQGLRNRQIGERLLISEETVKWYLKRIYEVLGVGNRTHALVRAQDEGLM